MKKSSTANKSSNAKKSSTAKRCEPCFNMTVGSKAQVWHGTAKRTSGGLSRNHLMQKPDGRIVSKKAHAHGKKMFRKNETVMRINQAPAFN